MKSVVLDTNAYGRLLTGDRSVFFAVSDADTVYMSVIVIAELLAVSKADPGKRRTGYPETFLSRPTVRILPATMETAEIFVFVRNNLKISGYPIPIHDVWIAAHTLETGSVLVTFDTHFASVPGLRIWK